MQLRKTLAIGALGVGLAAAVSAAPVTVAMAVHAQPLTGGHTSIAAEQRPSGYSIEGLDTAMYQHPTGHPHDWPKLRAAGVKFATVKATRGLNVTDPWFTRDLNAARAAGLAVAPYHFYTGTAPNTGAAQADRFISVVKKAGYTGHRPGDLPPVFDFERTDDGHASCPPDVSVADAKAWLDKVQAALGRQPIIYTQKSFLDQCLGSTTAFASYQMQLADYTSSITHPPLPKGSSTWLMWQYTGSARLNGMDGPGPADIFHGTQSDLNHLANR